MKHTPIKHTFSPAQSPFVQLLIIRNGNSFAANAAAFIGGVISLALLAQISIPLSFTPVPITGQTLGVALISLLWGRKRGVAVVATYLTLGVLGAPLFALGKTGLSFGPTSGYLIGMLFASFAMGTLADLGWTKSFGRTWLAAAVGSLITFTCGVAVLSLFVPQGTLLMTGVIPFIPGDFVKTMVACAIVRSLSRRS
ncbi:MAG: biotin transporter BioY [Bdellovibrionales bacterium]|jgi:biotin transport system substrate-specific component|nr:biotin transporter BioY [Bdellovibrionales bacterium]